MAGYDFASIESKWQRYWAENETFRQANPGEDGFVDKPKLYVLDMFPYPSGAGLHVGHPEGYTATDIVCRYARMTGRNVLHPMGYDSFGLPAEQYAVEHGVHPAVTTEKNIANIERQIKMFGFSYDWSRRVATTEPAYYRWTQWIFLQMFNSWFDPEAQAARPISELIRKFEVAKLQVSPSGGVVYPTPAGRMTYIMGHQDDAMEFGELSPEAQRQFIDSHRLAYIDEVPVNWCPQLGTVLANEEVTNEGRSERGDHPVFRRALRQWMLRITAYAERLLADVETVNWPEPIKIMQRNWIGRSEGAEVDFTVEGCEEVIRVFTTRPDTLFGATYMVLAPEHELVDVVTTGAQRAAVEDYVAQAANKTELERTADSKDKTGVPTGGFAVNPVNGEKVPIWVADYVMMGYGTGAIMAVPAHDTRDFEFATAFELPIVQVVKPPEGEDWRGYVGDGIAMNSGQYDGLTTAEFKKAITGWLEDEGLGKGAVNYKLRDWLFSRQRYWGEPFPIIHCDECGLVGVPEDQLPLVLPEMEDFKPAAGDDPDAPPQPPLGRATEWFNTTCPTCGKPATRELNAMPQWAGSCWYYLRYLDPANETRFCDSAIEQYWMGAGEGNPTGGVDLYVGGAEHAVLHLLYARFWHKVLFDLDHVSTAEPFGKLFNQGMIRSFAYRDQRGVYISPDDVDLSATPPTHKTTGETVTESVEKMSKSLRNVVNPDEIIAKYGADTFRLYEMFMGPLEASKPWNTQDVPGSHRFLQRSWRMIVGDEDVQPLLVDGDGDVALERQLHGLIKKVGEDVESMKFNTAIAAMMEFVNAAFKVGQLSRGQADRFVLVLAPFAPHIAEELWRHLGHEASLSHENWPSFDASLLVQDTVELPVQVNGKVRDRIRVAADASQEDVIATALASERIIAAIDGKTVVKTVVVPGRLVNIVVKG